ncbi:MAG TPA: phosphoenolpyruvate--protein phosphotransferase [Herpetosiphon sp.]|uniref:phosphoenolpyruvate--protein phosphotransferase n=1 Tax=Herpetosiphon aurantiacus (strain ATCC 23779 / DSM 785 / 114-95) TaxID=316274 RepID=A9B4K7_HERA2|nr:phosphoenolpyruvate--protein phosphotransferase [Herpetosiphon sp.]ABX04172.1 phosphoenolpyruvate-protein phosphotransferase [Herpetosiphon aurantiacus DSM 785]HBW48345.1 phosphoenolpyruvate--protein phosphotransferase [Herpetosiphon sp.]
MQELDLVIHNSAGLHARPARVLVDLAKQFKSTISIRAGGKRVNAKSMIALLTLGVVCGQAIQIEINGEDEAAAAEAITTAVHEGLGEGHGTPAANSVNDALVAARNGHANLNGHAKLETTVAVAEPPPAPAPTRAEPLKAGAIIQGIAGAPGIAVGTILRYERARIEISHRFSGVDNELQRLQAALTTAQQQLVALREQVLLRADASEAAIFDVHRDILADPALLEAVHGSIGAGQGAEVAWQQVINQQANAIAQLNDALLAERSSDIRDVGDRVLRLLVGAEASTLDAHWAKANQPMIVVAYDLTPSETAAFDPAKVLGFCTAVGGPNAHTAILARALGLPAVISAGPSVLELATGTEVILDGTAGTLLICPAPEAIVAAKTAQQREREHQAWAMRSANEPATTVDGQHIEVVANIGGLSEAQQATTLGADGVGLLRTEFLFLERTQAPTEDEQFATYREIAQAMGDAPVIVRTLDIGGDKPLPYLALPAEENPFLGERGIRLCLAHPELLQTQLRAILRAASFGRLRIMFPMIADAGELRAAKAEIERIRNELQVAPIEIGIMIEVPSAALMTDILAAEVDFFSIGTNDLTQYTLAMDRTHPTLAAQADGLHPAVLRLIARTVEAAHAAGKWVGVCGELGADPQAVPILVGLGVDELSVSVPAIPTVKAQIRALNFAQCQTSARRALVCATAAEVRQGAFD